MRNLFRQAALYYFHEGGESTIVQMESTNFTLPEWNVMVTTLSLKSMVIMIVCIKWSKTVARILLFYSSPRVGVSCEVFIAQSANPSWMVHFPLEVVKYPADWTVIGRIKYRATTWVSCHVAEVSHPWRYRGGGGGCSLHFDEKNE